MYVFCVKAYLPLTVRTDKAFEGDRTRGSANTGRTIFKEIDFRFTNYSQSREEYGNQSSSLGLTVDIFDPLGQLEKV